MKWVFLFLTQKIYCVFEKKKSSQYNFYMLPWFDLNNLTFSIKSYPPFSFRAGSSKTSPLPYSHRTTRSCRFVCECTRTSWQTAQSPGSGLRSRAFDRLKNTSLTCRAQTCSATGQTMQQED